MRYEESVEEWLEELPGDFEIDPIGMWEIPPAGRDGFGLEGPALVDFIKTAVRRLLDFGARPVKRRKDGPYRWVVQKQYGETIEAIVEALVAEQIGPDGEDLNREGLWFATPDMWTIRNQSIDEWMEDLAARLDHGPVSLGTITLVGRVDYDLTDADLLSFTQNAIRRLLELGAQPVKVTLERPPEFVPAPEYGGTVEDILDAVAIEWAREGGYSLWLMRLNLALPRFLGR